MGVALMDPITITTAALAIAKATGLTDWLAKKVGITPGEQVSRKVIDIAASVVGGTTPTEVLKNMAQQQDKREEIKLKIMDQELEILQLGVSDIRNARNMYLAKSTQANKIATNIMRFNLPSIIALIAANGLVIYYIENPAVAVAIGNVIGASISVMWQERQQVVGFFFGSSIGSQEKTELMANKQ